MSTTENAPKLKLQRDAWSRQPTLRQLTSHDIWWLRRAFLERLWPDVKGLNVLEVGSGPAHDSLTFVERGAAVTAVDHSQTGLNLARRIYHDLKLPISTQLADAENLPFENDQFDLAFNAGVLEHFTDDQLGGVIDEMIRVVKPGGHILAFCPNRYNVFYQHHLKRVSDHAYDFERAFTADELRKRIEARGINNVKISGVHVHPAPNYLLPPWLPKHHRIEPACRRCFRWLEQIDGLHRFKSLIGQDFVVWATVPTDLNDQESISGWQGGPAARNTLSQAA